MWSQQFGLPENILSCRFGAIFDSANTWCFIIEDKLILRCKLRRNMEVLFFTFTVEGELKSLLSSPENRELSEDDIINKIMKKGEVLQVNFDCISTDIPGFLRDRIR